MITVKEGRKTTFFCGKNPEKKVEEYKNAKNKPKKKGIKNASAASAPSKKKEIEENGD